MVWSSDSDEEDHGWTQEANRHRPLLEARRTAEVNQDELWNLYRCLLDYCGQQGYPFFAGGRRLSYEAFAEFVIAHSL